MSEPSYGDQINARLAKCNKLDGIMDMLNTINYEQAGTCLRGLPEVAQTKPCTFSSTRTNDMLTRCSLINQGNEDALTKPHTLLSSTSTNDELSRCSLTKQGNETAILPRFAGRYVSRMISASTLEISKRFVTPVFGQGDIRADLENFIRKLSNHRRLKNLLLVITPTSSKLADMWKLHCFAVDKQMHLGVTRLRSEERALVEKHHNQNNYHLMFCSQNLDLEDVFRATPIKKQIIESLQPECPPLRTVCYKGQPVALSYMLLEQADTEPIIKSLQAPKIPVRYRRTDGIDRNDRLALVQQQRYSQDSYSSCSVLYSRHKKEHVSSPSHPSRTAPKTVLNSAQLDEQKRQLEKQKEMIPNELREEEVESTIRDLLKQMNLRNQSISPDRLVESPLAMPQAKSKAVGPEQLESTGTDVRKQMNLRNPSKSTDRRKCIVESPLAGPQAECKAVSQEPEQLIKKHIKIGYTTIIENIKVNLGNINLKDPKREQLIKSKQIESKPKKQTALKMPNEEKQKIESPTEDKIIVLKPIPPRDDIENEIRVDSKEKRVNAKERNDVMERIVNEQECKQSEKQRNNFKKTTTREPDLESMLEHTKQKAKEAQLAKISKVKEEQTGQKQDTERKHLLAEQVELASAQAASTATIPSQTQTCKLRSLDDIIKQESPIIIKQPEPSSESMNLKISQGKSMSKIVASQPLKHDIPNKPVQEKQAEIRTPRIPNKQYVDVADLKENISTIAKQKKIVSKTPKDCITSKARVAFESWKKQQAGLKKPAMESMLAYKKQKSKEAQLAKISKEKGQTGQKQESEEKLLLAEQVELASAQAASQIQTCKLRFLDDIIKMESEVIKKQTAPSSESMNLKNSQGVSVSKLVASQTLEHDDPNEPLQAKQVEITSTRISIKQHVKVADLKENMSTTAQQKKLVSKPPKDYMTSKSRVPLRSWKKQQVGLKKPALESMLAHKQNSKEAQLAKISKEKGQTGQKQESEEKLLLAEQVELASAQAASQIQTCKLRFLDDIIKMESEVIKKQTAPSSESMNLSDSQGMSVSKLVASQTLEHDDPNEPLQAKQVEITSTRISNKQHVKVADLKENMSTTAQQKRLVSKAPRDCMTSKSRVPLRSWKKQQVGLKKPALESMLAHKQNSKEAQLAKISKEKGQTAQNQESEREAQLAKISKEKGQRGQKQESAQKRLPAEQVEIANDILMMESTGNVNFQDSQGKSVSKPTANQHLNYDFPNKARQKKQVEIRSPRISNKQNVKVADIKESKSTMAKQKKIVSKTSKARVPLKSWKKKSVCCFKASSEKMTSSWPSMLASEKRKMSEKEERKKREIEKQRNRHALNALRAESLSARDKHLQKQHAVYHAYKEKARQDREQAKCYQELAQRRQFQRFLSQISNVEASSQCSAQVSEPVSSKKPRLAKPQFNTCIRPQKDLESLNSDPRKEFRIPQQLCNLTETLRRLGHFEHLLKDHPPMENKSTQVGRASGDACRVKFVEPFELQANGNGIRFIWGPQELRKSQGRIKSQCYSMSLGCKHGSVYQNHCSIINQSSTSFEHIMSPVEVPSEYSMQARLLLRQKLRPLNLKLAFEKYGILIDCINRRPVPLDAHLMIFFQFVELLDLKLYVREEVYFPGFAPISQPKYRLECYIFDDRKDFFGSIALLATQLEQAIQQCPHLLHNLRHIDDAFYLTDLPQSLTSGLRHLFNFFRVRGLFSLLAELTYDWMQPPARVLALTQNQSQELEALICQKARDTRHKHLKED